MGSSTADSDRSAGLRARLAAAKNLHKQITYEDKMIPYPEGWELPKTITEFKAKGYTYNDFIKQSQRTLVKPFSGEVSDYFRFRSSFIKCVHVQFKDPIYKCIALDGYITDERTTAMFRNLGLEEPDYRLRIKFLEDEYGGEERYRNHLVEKLSSFKGFQTSDVDQIGDYAKCLRSYLIASGPMEAENIFLLQMLKTHLTTEIQNEYHLFLTKYRKEDDCISVCDYLEDLYAARRKTRDTRRAVGASAFRNLSGRTSASNAKKNQSQKRKAKGTVNFVDAVDSSLSDIAEEESDSEEKSEDDSEGEHAVHLAKAKKAKAVPKPKQCWLCHVPSPLHDILTCAEFICASVDERRRWAGEKKVCFLCLHKGHVNMDCHSKTMCKICKGRHHWLLHTKKPTKDHNQPKAMFRKTPSAKQFMAQGLIDEQVAEQFMAQDSRDEPSEAEVEAFTHVSWTMQNVAKPSLPERISAILKLEVTLPVVPIIITNLATKKRVKINCLLDSGSNPHALMIKAARHIGLTGDVFDYHVTVAGGTVQRYDAFMSALGISAVEKGSKMYKVASVCYQKPCGDLVAYNWRNHLSDFDHFKDLEIPELVGGGQIGMILGTRNRELMLASEYRIGSTGDPVAEKTPLGWTVCGPTKRNDNPNVPVTNAIMQPLCQYVLADQPVPSADFFEDQSSGDDSGIEDAQEVGQESESDWQAEIQNLQTQTHNKTPATSPQTLTTVCDSVKSDQNDERNKSCPHQKEALAVKKLLQEYWEFESTEE